MVIILQGKRCWWSRCPQSPPPMRALGEHRQWEATGWDGKAPEVPRVSLAGIS